MTKIKIKIIALLLILVVLIPIIPRPVHAAGIILEEPLPGQTGAITEVDGLADYLVKIYNLSLIIAGVLAMAMIIYGGAVYMTSSYAGNLVKMGNGKEIINSALLGLAVALLSYLLIYTIDPNLTHPKDVFMEIPEGTCQGGIPNVDEASCKSMCMVDKNPDDFTMDYDSTDKCCKCGNVCSGHNKHLGQSTEGFCQQFCASGTVCPAGKVCEMKSYTNGCCECSQKDQAPQGVCRGETKPSQIKCNKDCIDKCSAMTPPQKAFSNYTSATKCCSCECKP